jgi:hypothetical protein
MDIQLEIIFVVSLLIPAMTVFIVLAITRKSYWLGAAATVIFASINTLLAAMGQPEACVPVGGAVAVVAGCLVAVYS